MSALLAEDGVALLTEDDLFLLTEDDVEATPGVLVRLRSIGRASASDFGQVVSRVHVGEARRSARPA